MARRYDSAEAKQRILSACAHLFLEKGYTNTTLAEILKMAGVSTGSFQNIFRTKDGVLTEFVRIMYSGQFGMARELTAKAPSPAHVYAIETALQLALVEMNENLRDVYVEAYTYLPTAEFIHRHTAVELLKAFGRYMPECKESDFYEMDLGTAGIMRSFMIRECDPYFTLEQKIRRFLQMTLCIFHVPKEEQTAIIGYVTQVDVRAAAKNVMEALFKSLSMQFDLTQ